MTGALATASSNAPDDQTPITALACVFHGRNFRNAARGEEAMIGGDGGRQRAESS
jgi:hypothetical protein